jgi:hypothetical protein
MIDHYTITHTTTNHTRSSLPLTLELALCISSLPPNVLFRSSNIEMRKVTIGSSPSLQGVDEQRGQST